MICDYGRTRRRILWCHKTCPGHFEWKPCSILQINSLINPQRTKTKKKQNIQLNQISMVTSMLLPCYAADLRGGAVVPIGHLHRHVVVGVASSIEPAGDGDGSRVPLDVEVLLLVATWGGGAQTHRLIPSGATVRRGHEPGRVQLPDEILPMICHTVYDWFWLVAGMMRLGVDLQSLDHLRDFPEEGAVNDGSLSNFAGLQHTPHSGKTSRNHQPMFQFVWYF